MNWLLALNFFVHMIATIVWVGGIATLTLVLWPAARRMHGPGRPAGEFMADVQRRFSPLAMLSLAALVVTGLGQMAANPKYEGLLSISNAWAGAILLKHIGFAVMAVVGAYLTWGLQPALSRLALLEAAGRPPAAELDKLRRRQQRLHQLNAVCGLIVLAFTAIARVA